MPMRVRQLAQLIPSAAADPIIVSGGPGNDTIDVFLDPNNPTEWPNVIDGGGGFDNLNLTIGNGADFGVGTASVSASFSDLSRPSIVTITGVLSTPVQISVVNFEQFRFIGAEGNDSIHGGRYNDTLIGGTFEGSGNNTLMGGAGDDILDGGSGFDRMFGGAGNDTLLGLGDDEASELVFGGPGSDTFRVTTGVFIPEIPGRFPPIPDTIGDFASGPGGDVLSIGGPVRLVQTGAATLVETFFLLPAGRGGEERYFWDRVVQLNATDATLLTGANIPAMGAAEPPPPGTARPDTLVGTVHGDVISAAGGNDTVYGANGNDTLNGGGGDDSLDGGVGRDFLNGGTGHDELFGNLDDDTLVGGAGNDSLLGDFGADLLQGQAGDDTLFGGRDADTLLGGDGDDFIFGENGADVIRGGVGNDTLSGGPNRFTITNTTNVFVYGAADVGADRITDFQVFEDRLDLNGLGIYNSAAALAVAEDSAEGAVITVGGVSITLGGVSLSLLTNFDFVV